MTEHSRRRRDSVAHWAAGTFLASVALVTLAGCGPDTTTQFASATSSSRSREAEAAAPGSANDEAASDPLAARSKGSPSAPVTVYEMSDFQCPYCRRHALETFPILEREYVEPGKVRWVFINFPLTSLHPNAVAAAEVALCAANQNKFWPVHDLLFEHQQRWAKVAQPQDLLLQLADSAGVDRGALVACLQAPETRKSIEEEARASDRAGASSTPTFYIEGGLLVGAHPAETFRKVLDSIVAAKGKK